MSQKKLRELETQLESMRDRLRDYVRMQRLRAQVRRIIVKILSWWFDFVIVSWFCFT